MNELNYLLTLLEGQAFKLVEGLELTEDNYKHAVEILKARFHGKQHVISAHMESLLKLQSLPNQNTEQLRKIYDEIYVDVRVFQSLGDAVRKLRELIDSVKHGKNV